jgi:hypothetical protein
MYITCKIFIPKLRLVARSMLFILCSPDLRGGRSVLTRCLIIRFTCVICKHDGIIGRVNMDMWSVSWFYFILFIFNQNWCMSGYSSDSNRKSKSQRKASGLPHTFGLSFRNMERYKLVHVRNRCCNVWVVSLYTCHNNWIFSVFRLQPLFAFMSPTTVSWINCCTFEPFYFRSGCRWAVPGGGQTRGWPWQPLNKFSMDGVADSGRVPHRIYAYMEKTQRDSWRILLIRQKR